MIIGLHGNAGSGKDTVANFLCNHYGFIKLSFAETLKKIVQLITGWDYEFINGNINRELRETLVHPLFGLTCRQMLQFIGTDLFKFQFNTNIWIYTLLNNLDAKIAEGITNIVITDCRFYDEINILQTKYNAMIWNIKRNNLNVSTHISEQFVESEHSFTIENNGSLDELYHKINIIVQQFS